MPRLEPFEFLRFPPHVPATQRPAPPLVLAALAYLSVSTLRFLVSGLLLVVAIAVLTGLLVSFG